MHGKTLNLHIITISLKYLLQLGMMNLPNGLYSTSDIKDYLQCVIKKHEPILLSRFTSIKSKIGLLFKNVRL